MSEDRVVPFVGRPAAGAEVGIAGTVSFSNGDLRLVGGAFQSEGPEWSLNRAQVEMEAGMEPFHGQIGSRDFAPQDDLGWVSQNEHGVNGLLNLPQPYFDLLQAAALSSADLQLALFFGADEKGEVVALTLSIERKPTA